MKDTPDTRYVAVGDAQVAYQVVGEGPHDLCYFFGASHIDLRWDHPLAAEFFQTLASFSRLILLDRRGTGASDAVPNNAVPTWEEWTEDLRAVFDAIDSRQTAIFAEFDGGPIAMLFAAMHPNRVRALVLANTTARFRVEDDYPIGWPNEACDAYAESIRRTWGTPQVSEALFPSRRGDAELSRWVAKALRGAMTPGSAEAQFRNFVNVDVRSALPLIRVPTLVLHSRGNLQVPYTHGRYVADHIANARFVELATGDAFTFGSRSAIQEVGEFLTGDRPVVEVDRILTTMLFTDIVGSTELAASLGDQAWRSLLDAHDRTVRDHLRRYRGNEIKTTGDGFLASFDGPAQAIRCALTMAEATRALGIELHLGLHTGECEVRGDDLFGLAVHIAARIASLTAPGELLVSGTVKDLVAGSRIEFMDRGEHELRGVPGNWRLFSVEI